MRIGVICPSEIAFRRFMPALGLCGGLEFAGIGVFRREEMSGVEDISDTEFASIRAAEMAKASSFVDQYGGHIFDGYESLVTSPDVDAVYIPLPPALHYMWAKKSLENGKHVLVEKPATVSLADTTELVRLASSKGLALHENYMFAFHDQLARIDELISSGEIGDVRLYRVSFGFPMRAANDFRYKKALGGGALLDAGGYTIKYASRLLGDSASVAYAVLNGMDGFEVDMYGSGALVNDDGVTVQVAFGMDNNYKCELEAWGSQGCLTTGRVLTAPAGFVPTAVIRKGNEDSVVELPSDDAFLKSIRLFAECTASSGVREARYREIVRQAELVDQFMRLAGVKND
ncbi:hypothetical protein SAMN02910456_02025 [Ruminococcaceae bacterium YRB3002]|nr:hypothetical protein SAMN02910456_02025 [Ruminococcaceae bacterium YRB3002]